MYGRALKSFLRCACLNPRRKVPTVGDADAHESSDPVPPCRCRASGIGDGGVRPRLDPELLHPVRHGCRGQDGHARHRGPLRETDESQEKLQAGLRSQPPEEALAQHTAGVASQLLKCTTFGVLVLFGPQQTAQNSYPRFPRGPYWTLLDVAHFALFLMPAALGVAKGCLALGSGRRADTMLLASLTDATCDFALALSCMALLLLVWIRWRRCLAPSGFACTLLGFLTTATILDAVRECTYLRKTQEITLTEDCISESVLVITYLLTVCTAGNFIGAGIRDLVVSRPNSVHVYQGFLDEDSVSVFSRIACLSLYPTFREARKKKESSMLEIPFLRRGFRCKYVVEALTARVSKGPRSRSRKPAFLTNVFKVLRIDVLRLTLCTVAYFFCIFARVPALELVIKTSGESDMTIASLLFVATCVGEWLISSYHMELLAVLGIRMRALLQGIIFRKATLLSPAAAQPTGCVASLLGVDCMQLCNFAYALPLPICGTLTLPLLFWMLSERAGVVPAVCCAAWALVTLLAPLASLYAQKRIWDVEIKARDERLKSMTDLLCNIRVVKMYAWEDALQANVLSWRKAEVKCLLAVNLLDAVLDSVCSSCSTVMMIILFATMSVFEPDRVLSPELSFSCVSLLYITDLMGTGLVLAFRNVSKASVSLKRISSFCTAEEYDEENKSQAKDCFRRIGAVNLENCTISWSSLTIKGAEPQLKNVTLDVEPGSLVGIAGFVGSGKSSLLSAILGDAQCLEGSVACAGRIAYVPQLPTVHNMTIRDNILYGRPLHPNYYERVLRSCQLMNDLNKIPAGDAAEVGEKGTNLSGGQKQRISLARAAYSNSDVYLLDDPLNALDPLVAKNIFREVIGQSGLLRNKTRIMVCNQGSYLRHMDKIVFVHDKKVRVYASLEELLRDPASPQNFHLSFKQKLQAHSAADSTVLQQDEENDAVGRITEEEMAGTKKTFWQLLVGLVRFTQWPALAGVVVLAASAAAQATQQLWIKSWTDASTADPDGAIGARGYWIGGLVGICVANVLCRLLGGTLLAVTARILSRSLHRAMLEGVLRSPVSFFDASPRGRVLNRFAGDLDFVDAESFISGKQCVQGALLTVASVGVVATQAPLIVAVTAAVAVLTASGFIMAVSVSHSSRYVDSIGLSKLLQHMTETLECLSSVRAYGVLDRFRRHFFRLDDICLRGYFCYSACYRFARSLTAVGGFAVVLSALLLNTLGSTTPDPSSLGLALSSATTVPLALMSLCMMLFCTLLMAVSFERCLEYSELPPETDIVAMPDKDKRASIKMPLPEKWPSHGMVEFQDYSSSYRPGVAPNVLNNVSFSVKAMEKVGVVGRTGAGKSSLVLALLRFLRASNGRICIDGVDIAQVPLKKLRRAITVIPQDPSLVRGTLRLNLDPMGSHTDEQIWHALRQAHLAPLVKGHLEGLGMKTADGGTNLSVGERQLVCLARALLRHSKVLLLDEATSQMDGDMDRLIQATLREAFGNSTLIAIAHRIHTVLDYDRILVMDEGRVREYDTPSSLLSDPDSAFYKMAADAGAAPEQGNCPLAITSL
ncbi:ATP-binding cassette sub-family C member 3-like isoform X3 [Dermacentor albipictus]|uniref:ATP-binding cassette sub-family C member 3-like isoform X3 n=1 Tax=Dermacentor albipictus TaxID=60249 RepID=UPI0038FC4AE0